VSWSPENTAVIVCDMWDTHTSPTAARRVVEMAPRMEKLLQTMRQRGATIIHAPSNTMDTYAEHPGRKRAQAVPKSQSLPKDIAKWCYVIPPEEQGEYPLEQEGSANDHDPKEKEKWIADLVAQGRNPARPWVKQIDTLTIAPQDYVTDLGEEVWSILEQHGIENVMLVGVHTNMCVLGRPFGLRQMSQNGKRVVLCRDMTDTMYDPKLRPYVDHFTGNELIVEHIEKYVCPSVTSNQILGGEPFRFKEDDRKRLAIVTSEVEYKTEQTLPPFALKHLGRDYAVTIVYGDAKKPNELPGLADALADADAVLVSVRRRTPPAAQLAALREFIESGKPVIAVRTASHAFALRNGEPADGHAVWPEFDRDVIGGNYHNHFGNGPKTEISVAEGAADHPILKGVDADELIGQGSLYRVTPLTDSTTPLLTGTIAGQSPEPVAWTNENRYGGRTFYTSLGHVGDFEQPAFNTLLKNGIDWAVNGASR
jgi:nicotinamidase-related amidase/type 1 glutamine amidotransferase